MLYTKQQAADKINKIYTEHSKGPSMDLPEIDRVLEKLNNRKVVSIGYFLTKPSNGTPSIGFNVPDQEYDLLEHYYGEINLIFNMLVLVPFGEAWTDDITMRLLVLSGLNYEQSFFDNIMNSRYQSYKTNKGKHEMSESELFEEFIKAQNKLVC
jgi:hypothetical protein